MRTKYQIVLSQHTCGHSQTLYSILYAGKDQAEKDATIMRICFPFSHTEINPVEVDE